MERAMDNLKQQMSPERQLRRSGPIIRELETQNDLLRTRCAVLAADLDEEKGCRMYLEKQLADLSKGAGAVKDGQATFDSNASSSSDAGNATNTSEEIAAE
jgi:hypothetical protein